MFFKRQPVTRLFYASDIHGSERLFRKFLNSAKVYNVSILIMGGDITGKAIVPCVRQQGKYVCVMMDREFSASTEAELSELHRLINYNGLYPRDMEPEEAARMQADYQFRERIFLDTVTSSLCKWLEIADEKLRGSGVTCYLLPGNDDNPQIIQILSNSDAVINPEGKVVELDEYHEMISLGYSNPTPWNTERELTEDQLTALMEKMVGNVKHLENMVVNFHAPPYDSQLDIAPQLGENYQIQSKMGQPILVPVGSTAVRSFIEKYQPLLGLHGHVHESNGIAHIGRTLCINPGSAYTDGILAGVIVGLKKEGLGLYQMVRG